MASVFPLILLHYYTDLYFIMLFYIQNSSKTAFYHSTWFDELIYWHTENQFTIYNCGIPFSIHSSPSVYALFMFLYNITTRVYPFYHLSSSHINIGPGKQRFLSFLYTVVLPVQGTVSAFVNVQSVFVNQRVDKGIN
jgi:hypothetical protein